jgi:hypothetical protein
MAWYDEILNNAEPYLPGRKGPGVGMEIKGQPISTLSDNELVKQYGAMPELEAGAVSQTIGRNVLAPYYGENLDAEIAKAKAFDKAAPEAALPWMKQSPEYRAGATAAVREWNEDQNMVLENPKGRYYSDSYSIDYEKIDEPVKTKVGVNPWDQTPAQYSPSKGITLNSPEFIAKKSTNYILRTERESVQEYLRANNMESQDLREEAYNPRSSARETLEHEIGHHFTGNSPDATSGAGHIGEPREMSNALGKIQRDTYVLYGQRFETPSQFNDYIRQERGKPQEDRFKGYSNEAKRGLRSILESSRDVRMQAINAIPKFVSADPDPEPGLEDYLDYWKSRPQVA